MLKKIILIATVFSTFSAAYADKTQIELNRVKVITFEDKSLGSMIQLKNAEAPLVLSFHCRKTDSSDVVVSALTRFSDAPLFLERSGSYLRYLSLGSMKTLSDCERINKCAQTADFNEKGSITVVSDSANGFSLVSLGESCKGI